MFKNTLLIILILFCTPAAWCDTPRAPSTELTPQQAGYIKEINQVLLAEIEKGMNALKNKNPNEALARFIQATNIAPYDPMAYQLLIETMIHSGQDDFAYQILEKAGHNNTDSNAIIKTLHDSVVSVNSAEEQAPLPRISLSQFKDNKACAISFVFDDGEPSVATAVLPMFEEFGWRTTVAINPAIIPSTETDPYRAGWGAWRRALINGHEIANHGLHHEVLPGLSKTRMKEEIENARTEIFNNLGMYPRSFVFPQDKSDPDSIKLASQNHIAIRDHETLTKLYSRICIPVFGGKYFSSDSGQMMMKVAMMKKLWLIPECHGLISPLIKKSFKSLAPEVLRTQLEFLHAHSDQIWVARFITVFSYLTERKASEIKVLDSSDHKILFELKNNLDKKLFLARLTVMINPSPEHPTQVQAISQTSKTWIPSFIKDGIIMVNILPNSGPIEVEWK